MNVYLVLLLQITLLHYKQAKCTCAVFKSDPVLTGPQKKCSHNERNESQAN